MVKATYTLDVDTVRALEALARRLNISKSEALRRAIHAASGSAPAASSPALAALDRLQRSAGLTSARAAAWMAQVRTERRSASIRRAREAP